MIDQHSPDADSELDRIRRALGDRYAVERSVGAGGMASVYLAEDVKHHRQVALKVMHRELAASMGADRFLREVEIAARLSHPHILPMHDSGQADGLLWYVMPFVDGESLHARIAREGALALGDAVRIAREVADALDYAHRQGIVHRDIKPANILLSEGHALVADFGIARALKSDGESITRTGFAVGTPQYMSPEQATGESDVDGRTDIYALGAVTYEMVAGKPPFDGPSMQSILTKMLTETPELLSVSRDGVPAELNELVSRTLAREPADRPQTAGDVRESLRRVEAGIVSGDRPRLARTRAGRRNLRVAWAAALSVVLAATVWGGTGLLRKRAADTSAGTASRRVAVLPFRYSGSAEDTLFAEGIVDEVRGKLSRVPGLAVLASTSTNTYRGTAKSVQQIARELRATYLLVGQVRWAGSGATRKVQVMSEMVSGDSGLVRWQQSFDAAVTDVFKVQADLASQVAVAIGAVLAPEDARDLVQRPTTSLPAWNLFLQAKSLMNRREQLTLLEQAVALDSNFAEGWALLADVASAYYMEGSQDPANAKRAREAIERLRVLRPGSALLHFTIARYYDSAEPSIDRTIAETDSALQLAPNEVTYLAAATRYDIAKGRLDSAVARLTRARELDPRSPNVIGTLHQLLLSTKRLSDAIALGEEVAALSPKSVNRAKTIAMAFAANGDLTGARASIQAALARGITAPALAANFAGFLECAWILDSAERKVLYRLTPEPFENDRAWWAQSLATAHWDDGDRAVARAYADSALAPSKLMMDKDPKMVQNQLLYGLMLAYVGRSADGIREGEQAMLRVTRGKGSDPAYEMQTMARIYTVAGQPDKAIALLRDVLPLPWHISKQWLQIDPGFAALRTLPAFRQMTGR